MSAHISVPLAFSIVKKKKKKKESGWFFVQRKQSHIETYSLPLLKNLWRGFSKKEARVYSLPKGRKSPQHLTPASPWKQQPPLCSTLANLVYFHWLNLLTHSSDAPAAATHVISLKEYYVFLPTSAKRLEIKTDFLEDLLWDLGEGPFNYFLCLFEELPPGP